MAVIKPFYCIRPTAEAAHRVAALPYDVYDRKEAKEAASKDSLSFLNIDRPETQFPDDFDMYDECVYQKAGGIFKKWINDKILIKEESRCYYIYELIMDGRSQTGIVGCASIDDYINNEIKKHENTREDKELDRIRHVDALNAQTGPIFLAYRSSHIISCVVNDIKKNKTLYSFMADDGIIHNVWCIDDKDTIKLIEETFSVIESVYIADGHHRAAASVKAGLKRRQQSETMPNGYNGTEEYNYFLSVLFPEDELMILPYNRVVKDLNGLSKDEFIDKLNENFNINLIGDEQYSPDKKGYFGMYLDNKWYKLEAKDSILYEEDVVKALDVSLLQDYILAKVLGINDPRTDKRIDFIGGIRGLTELEKRVNNDMAVAFSMYPTSIKELFQVSDAGLLMPPKSTWFEPKLRSGLFMHEM